ncbi:tetratricopeptide repeat protein [bacterium SCSIO 12696]|nr:tetratricopeptide repeat protein [bacterium SCSIO 12696]
MIFTKKILALFAAALLLTGCGSLPLLSGGDQAETVVENEPEESKQAVADEQSQASINPYLENRKSIPAAAQKRFAQALAAMDNGQWQQAEEPLLQITIDYPKLSGAYLNLGICYRHMGKPKLAEDYFMESIRANANNLDAYNWLALTKREGGDFKAAENLYQQALAVWPDHPESHYNLAVLSELYMGNLEQARHHFSQHQKLLTEPDKRIAAWIKDLQRRINALADNGATP